MGTQWKGERFDSGIQAGLQDHVTFEPGPSTFDLRNS